MIEIGQLGAPSGFDDGRGVGLADQRRAGDTIARPQIDAIEHWCDMLGAGGPHDDLVHRVGATAIATRNAGLANRVAGAGRLDRHRFDDQGSLGRSKAEPGAVCLGKHRYHLLGRAIGYDQGRIGAGIAQMQHVPYLDTAGLGSLRRQGLARLPR